MSRTAREDMSGGDARAERRGSVDHAVVRDVWLDANPRVSQGGVYEGLTDPIHSTANIQLANKSSDAQEGKSASLTHPDRY